MASFTLPVVGWFNAGSAAVSKILVQPMTVEFVEDFSSNTAYFSTIKKKLEYMMYYFDYHLLNGSYFCLGVYEQPSLPSHDHQL